MKAMYARVLHKAPITLITCLLLGAILSLCACGLMPNSGYDATDANGTHFTLVEKDKLTVAASLDFPPFENFENNEAVGFEVDVMKAIAQDLGLELNYLPSMKFDTIIPAIAAGGSADVGVSGFTITPKRLKTIDFSDPICDTNQSIVTLSGSPIKTIEDLKGLRIGGETGTTGLDLSRELINDAEEIIAFDEYPAVFAALQSGQMKAAVLDKPVSEYYIKTAYPDCEVVQEIPTGEQYGIAISKDNPGLTEAINNSIKRLEESGKLDELKSKWF